MTITADDRAALKRICEEVAEKQGWSQLFDDLRAKWDIEPEGMTKEQHRAYLVAFVDGLMDRLLEVRRLYQQKAYENWRDTL